MKEDNKRVVVVGDPSTEVANIIKQAIREGKPIVVVSEDHLKQFAQRAILPFEPIDLQECVSHSLEPIRLSFSQ